MFGHERNDKLTSDKVAKNRMWTNQNDDDYDQGGKAGKLLAWRVKR